ncbi:MAG: lipoyl(octanoyl) transferase LipB [Bacteroidetes bacterium]|nr:lipoyl(octanoyl) transferase LipB [Bacteroidota bacterium]
MQKQEVIFEDLGRMGYREAWDYQEMLMQKNLAIKSEQSRLSLAHPPNTKNYFLFVEHDPVYTLGKSGHMENILITEEEMNHRGIQFFKTNRGGDITFHGHEQIVGYPILDLEKFDTDIGKYMRNLEEVIIRTLRDYQLTGERSAGETGVWIDPGIKGRERKIAALGVRCSRWVTMHGFALNVNTDLSYFNDIIPCGIQQKEVTSIQKELGEKISLDSVKQKLKKNFEMVFDVDLVEKFVASN